MRDEVDDFIFGLGPKRELYLVWVKAVYEGDRFFNTDDRELQGEYRRTYFQIEKMLVGDQIEEVPGRQFKDDLVEIGEKALRLRGDEDALSDEDAETIRDEIGELREELRDEATPADDVKEEMKTPLLNRKQALFDNILRWAEDDDILRGSAITLTRNATGRLERKEDRYKEDEEVDDKERDTLHEEAREIARELLQELSEA